MIFRQYRQIRNPITGGFILLFVCGVSLLSSQFFFNSDTIFYISRRIHSLTEVVNLLGHYDDRTNFRPLTYGIASGLLVPLAGLRPWIYHLLAGLIHCWNSYLAFRLAERLTGQRSTALLAAFFFSLHWVFFHTTYGMVCLPDLSYVFFGLLSLLTLLKHGQSGRSLWIFSSLGAYLAALGCKETAVVLPFLGTAASWHQIRQQPSCASLYTSLRQAVFETRFHWLLTAIYLVYFAFLGGGSVFPQDPNHPYAVAFSWKQLLMKLSYLQWWTNLPVFYDVSQGPSLVMNRLAEYISLTSPSRISAKLVELEVWSRWTAVILWVPVLFYILRRTFRSAAIRLYFYLGLAFLASLGPVLFLTNKLMPHNLYLAVFGFALWTAVGLDPVSVSPSSGVSPIKDKWYSLRLRYAVLAFLLLTLIGLYQESARSWQTHGSMMARMAFEDLKIIAPHPSPTSGLFFLRDKDSGQQWYYDGGNLFRVLRQQPNLRVRFQGYPDPFPDSIGRNSNVHILESREGHIIDVTDQYLHYSEREGKDLTSLFDFSTITMDTREYYPDYQAFDTPNKKAVFSFSSHRSQIARTVIVTLAGASITAHIPADDRPAVLALGLCLLSRIGDGAQAKLTIKDEYGEKILYQAKRLPSGHPENDGWLDVRIDLAEYAGRNFDLRLECSNSQGNNAIGDWLAWSLVLIPKAR